MKCCLVSEHRVEADVYFLQTVSRQGELRSSGAVTAACGVRSISCLRRVILDDQGACSMKHAEARDG